MIRQFNIIPLLAITSIGICTVWTTPKAIKQNANSSNGFAVVELFTSEGCSSCPPADKAVASLMKEYSTNVYVLGFHVDYWDYLGWKDAFSNAAYSQRQQQYASLLGLNTIYTPQIIVNGKKEFVGSDESTLKNTVQSELDKNNTQSITLTLQSLNNNNVVIAYKSSADANTVLNMALIEKNAVTQVKRGENEGKRLEHINIVRSFKTSTTNEGVVNFSIPAEGLPKDFKVIAFLQNKNTGYITGAAAIEIQ